MSVCAPHWNPPAASDLAAAQLMLPDVFAKVLQRIGHPDLLASLGFHTLPYLAFYGAATVAVAALSWHCLEAPINRLKDRFEYR